jgi:hypothetical protein
MPNKSVAQRFKAVEQPATTNIAMMMMMMMVVVSPYRSVIRTIETLS